MNLIGRTNSTPPTNRNQKAPSPNLTSGESRMRNSAVTLKPAGRPIHSALRAYCHLVTTRYPVSRAAMCLAPKELAQAGPSQPPGAAGASELSGATMSAFADIVFCRAKSALQNNVKAETPSLSLRLSALASGAKARTTPGSTPDIARPLSAIVRPSSGGCPVSSCSRPGVFSIRLGYEKQHGSAN